MTERTRTRASDASGPLHATQMVPRGMCAMAVGLAHHLTGPHNIPAASKSRWLDARGMGLRAPSAWRQPIGEMP